MWKLMTSPFQTLSANFIKLRLDYLMAFMKIISMQKKGVFKKIEYNRTFI